MWEHTGFKCSWKLNKWFGLLTLVCLSFLAHWHNFFEFPRTYEDEGVYASRALSVLNEGKLSPYTYWYDHAPAGWILVSGWYGVTNPIRMFNSAIDSGRFFMLLLNSVTIILLFHICKKHLSFSNSTSLLSLLVYSFSPLAIYYHRLLLLDNIMNMWLLLSLFFVFDKSNRISRLAISGVFFGLAVLSKETALMFLPFMLIVVLINKRSYQGRFAVPAWLLPMMFVSSLYPLYAILKGELLPPFISGYLSLDTDRVSLFGSLLFQFSRLKPINLSEGMNVTSLYSVWIDADPFLVVGGCSAVILNLILGVRNRDNFFIGLLGLLPLIYLLFIRLVFDFYILFAIPFLCINIGAAIREAQVFLSKTTWTISILSIFIGYILGIGTSEAFAQLYHEHPVVARREAIGWVRENLPSQSMLVVSNDLFTDLRFNSLSGPVFPNAHSYTVVTADPFIRENVLQNDWRLIDYVLISSRVKQELSKHNNWLTLQAMDHSNIIQSWGTDYSLVELWEVNK